MLPDRCKDCKRCSYFSSCPPPIYAISNVLYRLSVADYFSIINLICEDFPFGLVRSAAALVLVDDAVDCLLPFTDFYPAFQLLFFFQEFVAHCRTAYVALLSPSPASIPPSLSLDVLSIIHAAVNTCAHTHYVTAARTTTITTTPTTITTCTIDSRLVYR